MKYCAATFALEHSANHESTTQIRFVGPNRY